MRTRLDIDDDVMEAAKEIARLKNVSIGRAISELARRGLMLESAPMVRTENGIPVWQHGPGAIPITTGMIRSLAEE